MFRHISLSAPSLRGTQQDHRNSTDRQQRPRYCQHELLGNRLRAEPCFVPIDQRGRVPVTHPAQVGIGAAGIIHSKTRYRVTWSVARAATSRSNRDSF